LSLAVAPLLVLAQNVTQCNVAISGSMADLELFCGFDLDFSNITTLQQYTNGQVNLQGFIKSAEDYVDTLIEPYCTGSNPLCTASLSSAVTSVKTACSGVTDPIPVSTLISTGMYYNATQYINWLTAISNPSSAGVCQRGPNNDRCFAVVEAVPIVFIGLIAQALNSTAISMGWPAIDSAAFNQSMSDLFCNTCMRKELEAMAGATSVSDWSITPPYVNATGQAYFSTNLLSATNATALATLYQELCPGQTFNINAGTSNKATGVLAFVSTLIAMLFLL